MSMYAKGMSQRDIADTIEDIYGFDISHEAISNITDQIIEIVSEWQNRPLKKFYTFIFVDCLYVNIRKDMESKNCAVYVVLGYDVNGIKDILSIWIGEFEGKHYRMQIFDEIKARVVEYILFISMDGVSELEDGAKSIFKDATVRKAVYIELTEEEKNGGVVIRNGVPCLVLETGKAFLKSVHYQEGWMPPKK